MLCYASLAYMPWPEGLRRDIARKRKFEWFASIWSLIAILWPSLYIFQSWVLDWTESPITNRESAAGCNRISKTKNWSRGQDSGWKERGEATTTACMFGRGSALRMTFESFFFFYFSENSTNSKLARLDHFNFEAFSTFARTGTYSSYFVTRPLLTPHQNRHFKMVEKSHCELWWCSIFICLGLSALYMILFPCKFRRHHFTLWLQFPTANNTGLLVINANCLYQLFRRQTCLFLWAIHGW